MSLHFSIPFLLSLVSFGCVWTSGASHSHINTSLAPLLPPCCPPPHPLPLLPSHLSLPSFPIPSPPTPPPPPTNTPQINTGLIREGGDAEHIARSAGRKERGVCHCALSLSLYFYFMHLWFFSNSVSSSTQTAKPIAVTSSSLRSTFSLSHLNA